MGGPPRGLGLGTRPFLQFPDQIKSLVHIRTEFVHAEAIHESGLEHHFHRLWLNSREVYLCPVSVELIDGDFECVETAGIHRGDIAHAEDDGSRSAS